MAFKQLKRIDDRTKLSVHGWIREHEKMLKIKHIPSMINAVCILYIRDDEIFAIVGKGGIKVSENKKRITKICNEGWDQNAYGIFEVPSHIDGIYEWKLKIIKSNRYENNGSGIRIGIASKVVPNGIYYGKFYQFMNGGWRDHINRRGSVSGGKFRQGDELTMHLDLREARLRLIVNGEKRSFIPEDIYKSKDIKYRLIVSLFDIGHCVEIVDFSKKMI